MSTGTAEYNDWCIKINTKFSETFGLQIAPADADCNFNNFPLANYTGRMDIRTEPNSSATLIRSITTGGGGMTIDSVNSTILIEIDRAVTATFTDFVGDAFFDVFLFPPAPNDDDPFVPISGRIQIVNSVTNG